MTTGAGLFLSGLGKISNKLSFLLMANSRRGSRQNIHSQCVPRRERSAERRRGSMMTYKTVEPLTIMRVAGSATSAMRKPQRGKRVRNDEA
jgi:hypothetical protein